MYLNSQEKKITILYTNKLIVLQLDIYMYVIVSCMYLFPR